MEYYLFILYIVLGIIPSFTWLLYYLRKDLHPEPKFMLLKIFLFGSLITIPAFFIQIGLSQLLDSFKTYSLFVSYPLAAQIIQWFFIIAFSEEMLKYSVVHLGILKSYALDEPLDIMLYMVVAALGFAAVENILYLFSPIPGASLSVIVQASVIITFVRFIGATFLHTLCSATLGFFVAMSFLKPKKGLQLSLIGIFLATLAHGLYDFSITVLPAPFTLALPVLIIVSLAVFVMWAFNKVKNQKGLSEI